MAGRNVDRTVEITAEGPRDALEEFFTWLQHGPPLAWGTTVVADWWEVRGDRDAFEVRS